MAYLCPECGNDIKKPGSLRISRMKLQEYAMAFAGAGGGEMEIAGQVFCEALDALPESAHLDISLIK